MRCRMRGTALLHWLKVGTQPGRMLAIEVRPSSPDRWLPNGSSAGASYVLDLGLGCSLKLDEAELEKVTNVVRHMEADAKHRPVPSNDVPRCQEPSHHDSRRFVPSKRHFKLDD